MDLQIALQLTAFGLVWGGLYSLTALGLNLVYGVMKILNIAHGEFLMLGAYTTFWLLTLWGISPLLSLPVSILLLFAFGAVVHRLVVAPIVRQSGNSILRLEKGTLIVFFGVLMFVQNGALLLWKGDYRVVDYLSAPLNLGGLHMAGNRLLVLGISLLVTVALHFFLNYTFTGKAIRAISQDREAGLLMAIDAGRIGLVSFALGTAVAGLAGSLAALIYVITPTMGLLFTLKAFTVMVVGGLGSVLGTLAAGLFLGVAESWGAFLLGEGYRDAIDYVLLVLIILLISYGLLRGRERLAL